jgi:hypothetical protein
MLSLCLSFGPELHADLEGTGCELFAGNWDFPNGDNLYFPNGHPRCLGVRGDPHLKTYDKRLFDLHTGGEFVATRSLDDNLQVQVRLTPRGPVASLATAAAAQVGAHRVMIETLSDTPLRIDGAAVELMDGYFLPIDDGHAWIFRSGNRYTVVWPDGTNMHVDVFSELINLWVLAAEPRDGRVVGLLGNADGVDGNDFRTRDGTVLPSPPDFETLYKVFAESWRISGEESLFHYNDGETTETFTHRDHPVRRVTIDDLDAADRARAEQRCRAAGVIEPEAFAECVFDFGLTGDEVFIESALSLQKPAEWAEADENDDQVTLHAPAEAIAAHSLEVTISGPAEEGYWLGFAPAGGVNTAQAANPYSAAVLKGGEQVVKLTVPTMPGAYELRYREVRGSQTIVLRQDFRSTMPQLTIEAPAIADTGSTIDVRVAGDIGEFMKLLVVPAGSPNSTPGPERGLRQGSDGGGTIRLRNTEPGEYEIRCVSSTAAGRQVYARRDLTIR